MKMTLGESMFFTASWFIKLERKKVKKQKVKCWNKRDLERREDFSAPQWCFWHSAVQMELLTHCFNTLCFQQLHTVGDEGKKGGRWLNHQRHLSTSQPDWQTDSGGAQTSWWLRQMKVKVVHYGETIVNVNKCWKKWGNTFSSLFLYLFCYHFTQGRSSELLVETLLSGCSA